MMEYHKEVYIYKIKMLDFDRICRICLQISNEMYNVTNKCSSLPDTYLEMLRDCTRLLISDNDRFPKLICSSCTKSLEISFAFNLLCDKSNKILNSFIENESEILSVRDDGSTTVPIRNDESTTVPIRNDEIKTDPVSNEESATVPVSIEKQCNEDPNTGKDSDDEIKCEPNDDFDSQQWDDDDNIVLQNIKHDDCDLDPHASPSNNENRYHKIKKKKKSKRGPGRPRKDAAYVNPRQCDICGKTLSNVTNLNIHKRIHEEFNPYQCRYCPVTYRSHSALRKHTAKHLGIEKKVSCTVCAKEFSSRYSLKTHMLIHTGEKKFKCEVCLKLFTQKAQLMIHAKRHTKDRPFLCQVCGKGFPIKSELQVHERVHSGEKPYACILCPKTFASHGNMAVHLRIHRKEIRYTCNICQRGFVTHHSYSLHVKRHKGIRNYLCECGKAFYTLSLLKQHKVVHTRERMYQCKLCLKEFLQSSHCNRHYKKEHLKPGMIFPPPGQFKVVVNKKTRPTNINKDVELQHVFEKNGKKDFVVAN